MGLMTCSKILLGCNTKATVWRSKDKVKAWYAGSRERH